MLLPGGLVQKVNACVNATSCKGQREGSFLGGEQEIADICITQLQAGNKEADVKELCTMMKDELLDRKKS